MAQLSEYDKGLRDAVKVIDADDDTAQRLGGVQGIPAGLLLAPQENAVALR